jgi:hypothetical protein
MKMFNFFDWFKYSVLSLLAIFSIIGAFTANHYTDAILGWCFSIGLIIIIAALIFLKASEFLRLRALMGIVISIAIISTVQILLFRLNCMIITEETMYFKCETLYHMSNDSVTTESNGNQYVYLNIGTHNKIKSYLYKSKNANFKIVKTKNQANPYLDCKVYEKNSMLSYKGNKYDALYSAFMMNPMIKHLVQIKNTDEYYYKVVYLN